MRLVRDTPLILEIDLNDDDVWKRFHYYIDGELVISYEERSCY